MKFCISQINVIFFILQSSETYGLGRELRPSGQKLDHVKFVSENVIDLAVGKEFESKVFVHIIICLFL